MPTISLAAARRITPRLLLPFLDRIQHSPERLRLARGMFWSVAGAVSTGALGLVASVIVARILGKSVYGQLGIIQSTTNMFATFAQFGLGLTATKYVAEFRRKEPARAGRIIAMSTVVAVVCGSAAGAVMAATSPMAARLLAAPHLWSALAISALALILIVINEAQNGILSGFEAFRRRSAVQLSAAVASFPITVLGVYFLGLFGAVGGLIASQAVVVLLNYQAIQREASSAGVPILWREARKESGILARFSLPTVCCGAVYVPSMWIANMIMVNTPGGYAEMGVFNAADRWRTAILLLPGLLGGVTLPMLASLRSEAASQKYQKLLWTNIRLSLLASFAVAAPVALLAPWIMASYGSGFGDGTWVLITLCTTSVAFAPYWIVGQSLVSRGHMWTMFSFNLGWAATLLVCAWLMRGHGAQGLALAYLMADMVRLTAALIYANLMRSIES